VLCGIKLLLTWGKNGRDFGTLDPNCHNTSKFKNGVSSPVPNGET